MAENETENDKNLKRNLSASCLIERKGPKKEQMRKVESKGTMHHIQWIPRDTQEV